MAQQQAEHDEFMQLEEAITKTDEQINAHKKAINHIEKSNTWKASKAYRTVKEKMMNKEKVENAQLQEIIAHLEQALFEAEDKLARLEVQDTTLTNQAIYQQMRDLKKEGKLLANLDRFIQDKKDLQENYREAVTYAARLYMREEDANRQLVYEKILASLTIEEIPEFIVREGLIAEPIPIQSAASFRGSLSMRMRKTQLQGNLPEWPLDDKQTAYTFVENLNVSTPEMEGTVYTLETIPAQEGVVIKPADGAGARGVYLVHTLEDIFDVKDSTTLSSWSELIDHMQKDLQTEAVENDSWIVEQLVYESKREKRPARDLKFYSFYGKVGLILEIVRDPEVRQCWWTVEGERIGTGKYEESLFHGLGVTEEEIHLAKKISSEIPVPFLRIDFLRGEEGLVFGEFTPKPGNYDEFDERTDQLLGDYFLDAEARLVEDLLQGKEFRAYKELVNQSKIVGTN